MARSYLRQVLKPKPKEHRSVPIPDDLRDSLEQVWQIIQEEERDPDLPIDYGDAIQAGNVYGGRVGKGTRPFVLTYSPPGDADRGKWFLTFHPTEIEDIAEGVLSSLPMYCCTSSDCRCKFREPDELCSHCDYEVDPERGTFVVPEAISRLEALGVRGLSESSSLEDVKRILGQPFRTGGGDVVHGLTVHPWAKFRFGGRKIHVAFWTKSGRIKEVTL